MKTNNPIIRKILSTLMAILLLAYIGYQIYAVNSKSITTETAMYAELGDTIQVSAWAVRDEKIIHNTSSGVLSYNINDGDRVSKNSVIADIYSNEDSATAMAQIERLSEEAEYMEALNNSGNFYHSNPDIINEQINGSIINILRNSNGNGVSDLSITYSKLNYLLNQKNILKGSSSENSFQNKLNSIYEEIYELQRSSTSKIGTIRAPKSGYFSSNIDGYESSFDFDNIEDITVNEIDNISKTKQNSVIGKITTDFAWYFVCEIDQAQKIKLETQTKVYVKLPLISSETIPAYVISINTDQETNRHALVLKCNYMNANIASVRNETVQIIVDTYSGVLVNERSIYFEDVIETVVDEDGNTTEILHKNVKGVFVKYGSRINFVQIFSDITVNGYAICKTQLSEEEKKSLVTPGTITQYDEVVVNGDDLYDGKML